MLLDGEAGTRRRRRGRRPPRVEQRVRGHRPHVLVLDLSMPGGPILRRSAELRSEAPDTAIVATTMIDDPRFAHESARGGRKRLRAQEDAATRASRGVGAPPSATASSPREWPRRSPCARSRGPRRPQRAGDRRAAPDRARAHERGDRRACCRSPSRTSRRTARTSTASSASRRGPSSCATRSGASSWPCRSRAVATTAE